MQRLRERENNCLDGKPLPLKPTQIVYSDLHVLLALLQGRLTETHSYGETKQDRDAIAQAMSDMMFELVRSELKKLGHL